MLISNFLMLLKCNTPIRFAESNQHIKSSTAILTHLKWNASHKVRPNQLRYQKLEGLMSGHLNAHIKHTNTQICMQKTQ